MTTHHSAHNSNILSSLLPQDVWVRLWLLCYVLLALRPDLSTDLVFLFNDTPVCASAVLLFLLHAYEFGCFLHFTHEDVDSPPSPCELCLTKFWGQASTKRWFYAWSSCQLAFDLMVKINCFSPFKMNVKISLNYITSCLSSEAELLWGITCACVLVCAGVCVCFPSMTQGNLSFWQWGMSLTDRRMEKQKVSLCCSLG